MRTARLVLCLALVAGSSAADSLNPPSEFMHDRRLFFGESEIALSGGFPSVLHIRQTNYIRSRSGGFFPSLFFEAGTSILYGEAGWGLGLNYAPTETVLHAVNFGFGKAGSVALEGLGKSYVKLSAEYGQRRYFADNAYSGWRFNLGVDYLKNLDAESKPEFTVTPRAQCGLFFMLF